jgi:peptidoglycan/xylan/chitin deacetylase (PgdA/CDA1 family)
MNAFRQAARAAFHWAGGLEVLRWRHRRALRILMYHRFQENLRFTIRDLRPPESAAPENWQIINRKSQIANLLGSQCSYLRSRYQLLSLTAAADCLERGDLPPNSLCVTVDDGYRDFFECAFPVFRAYRIPVTVFLATGFLDGRTWLWTDIVPYLLAQGARPDGVTETSQNCGTPEAPAKAMTLNSTVAHSINRRLKQAPNAERLAVLQELQEVFSIRLPVEPPPEYAPLSWDQVRAMAREEIEFGAHTDTHPILSSLSREEARHEIDFSRRRIEEELDRPVLHFCYPNGQAEDVNDEVVALVRATGFRTAVMTVPGLNWPVGNPVLKPAEGEWRFRLRRIGVEPGLPQFYFRQCAAGRA